MVKVFLDFGHGGKDSGAVGNGLQEKKLTLTIGKKVQAILKNYDCEVMTSRDTDKSLTLKQRTDMANKWGADLLVSIHINAGGGTGFESFVYTNVPKETTDIQNIIHAEIMKHLGGNVRDRGKKQQNFHMLRESKMNAVLTENMFIDTVADANLLKKASFLDDIAKGHAIGIVKAMRIGRKEKPILKGETYYRVVAGSYKNRDNAERQVKELEKKGVKGVFITTFQKE